MDIFQEKIDKFLSENDHSPLIFEDYICSPDEFSLEKHTLRELVIKCAKIARIERSVLEDGTFQCKNGKSRSALDLWRHLVYYQPEVTFRQVLAVLAECDDVFYICSCPDVKRRTFYTGGTGLSPLWRDPDEFGLQFAEWKGFKE